MLPTGVDTTYNVPRSVAHPRRSSRLRRVAAVIAIYDKRRQNLQVGLDVLHRLHQHHHWDDPRAVHEPILRAPACGAQRRSGQRGAQGGIPCQPTPRLEQGGGGGDDPRGCTALVPGLGPTAPPARLVARHGPCWPGQAGCRSRPSGRWVRRHHVELLPARTWLASRRSPWRMLMCSSAC